MLEDFKNIHEKVPMKFGFVCFGWLIDIDKANERGLWQKNVTDFFFLIFWLFDKRRSDHTHIHTKNQSNHSEIRSILIRKCHFDSIEILVFVRKTGKF